MNVFITLADLTITHPVTAVTTTVRLGTHPVDRRSAAEDPMANYAARLDGDPTVESGLFPSGRLSGPSDISHGALVISNADGRYDWMLDCIGGAWSAVIRTAMGDPATIALADFTIQLSGKCGIASPGIETITVPLRDPMIGFENDLHASRYAGGNVGATGTEGTDEDLKGKVKPVTLGYCLQVPPAPANAVDKVMQPHDGAIEDIVEAYAAGEASPFTEDLANGRYTYTTGVGSKVLTADVKGEKTGGGFRVTPADLIAALATARGGFASVSAGDVSALNAAGVADVDCGFFSAAETSVGAAIDAIKASKRIWVLPDRDGVLRLGQLTAPAAPADGEIRPEMLDNTAGQAFEFLDGTGEDGTETTTLPVWRVTVYGARHWQPISLTDSATGLSDERRAALAQEWRSAPAEDEDILDDYPDASELSVHTALTHTADLQAEADAIFAIRRYPQQFIRVVCASRHVAWAWPGTVATFKHPRYGLENGALFRVMRRKAEGPRTTLELWRPRTEG